jgi:energy-coupling factor transporter ATP-binding protein EcfA2
MPLDKKSTPPQNKSVSISGDVVDSTVVVGDNNIIQKIINYIFPSEKETLEQRNRRILLGHVENAWIKGVLDASLHGAALLDLGIKQDPEAVTKYPWAIKKESTDETLPAGTSMLEIFDSIGMGRSLLILGASGSGKTTMLLELARQLIQRARADVTEPIPMVFNLASWTEKLTLADWLAQELNNLYSVPRKTAPDWIKGNKLLLLLDGLDEVRQESRAKCVEAINAFRKEHGLTSLAVCSRSQDYADLNEKLSFEGAIEVQLLTQKQITEFFNRFGDELAGIKQALEKDSAMREMAETPLFLSIMLMAYRDKQDVDIWISKDEKVQRKHLFDTYVERMFEHPRSKNALFEKQDIFRWLSWLASKMVKHNAVSYLIEDMQLEWLDEKRQKQYRRIFELLSGLSGDLTISSVDALSWNLPKAKDGLLVGLFGGLFLGLLVGLLGGLFFGLIGGLFFGLIGGLSAGLSAGQVDRTAYPGQRLVLSAKNFLFVIVVFGLFFGLPFGLFFGLPFGLFFGLPFGLSVGLIAGLVFGGEFLVKHYAFHSLLARNNLLPWRLVPFLDHCVDLIFLRRVGGGYIFVHRLLMEHFAEMYVETPTSKGN